LDCEVHERVSEHFFHVSLDVLRCLPDQQRLSLVAAIQPNRSTVYGEPDKVALAPLNAFLLFLRVCLPHAALRSPSNYLVAKLT
jgi:hypothetical protein